MNYCNYCGKKIMSKDIVCPYCGHTAEIIPKEDRPSVGLNVLAFLFPFIGLILSCIMIRKAPIKALTLIRWTGWGFCAFFLLYIFLCLVAYLLFSSIFGAM